MLAVSAGSYQLTMIIKLPMQEFRRLSNEWRAVNNLQMKISTGMTRISDKHSLGRKTMNFRNDLSVRHSIRMTIGELAF